MLRAVFRRPSAWQFLPAVRKPLRLPMRGKLVTSADRKPPTIHAGAKLSTGLPDIGQQLRLALRPPEQFHRQGREVDDRDDGIADRPEYGVPQRACRGDDEHQRQEPAKWSGRLGGHTHTAAVVAGGLDQLWIVDVLTTAGSGHDPDPFSAGQLS